MMSMKKYKYAIVLAGMGLILGMAAFMVTQMQESQGRFPNSQTVTRETAPTQ